MHVRTKLNVGAIEKERTTFYLTTHENISFLACGEVVSLTSS